MSFYYLPNHLGTSYRPSPVASSFDLVASGPTARPHHLTPYHDLSPRSTTPDAYAYPGDELDQLDLEERAALARLRAVQAERVRRQQQQRREVESQARLALEAEKERERERQRAIARQVQHQLQLEAEREKERQRQAHQRAIAAAAYEQQLLREQAAAARAEIERRRQVEEHARRVAAARQQARERAIAAQQQQHRFRQQHAQLQEQARLETRHDPKDGQEPLAALMALFSPFVRCALAPAEQDKKQPEQPSTSAKTEGEPVQEPSTGSSTAEQDSKKRDGETHPIEDFVKELFGAFLGPQLEVRVQRPEEEQDEPKRETSTSTSAPEPSKTTTETPEHASDPEARPTEARSTDVEPTQLEGAVTNEIENALDGLFDAFKTAFSGESTHEHVSERRADKGKGPAGPDQADKGGERTQEHAAQSQADKGKGPSEPEQPDPAGTTDDVPESAAHLAASREQSAAELIQQQYRRHLNRVRRLEKLDALERKLAKLDDGFTFPAHLDFSDPDETTNGTITPQDPVDGASSASGDAVSLAVPPLAFTPTNQGYHHHAQSLLSLLVSADTISSDGDKEVRKSRKEFVRRVEAKLAEMEKKRREVWERQQAEAKEVTVVEAEATPIAVTAEHDKDSTPTKVKDAPEVSEPTPAPAVEDSDSSVSSGPGQYSESEDEDEKKDGYEMI